MLRPAILPSSLNSLLPSALDYSSSPPVSVCGTILIISRHEAFLGNLNQQDCPNITSGLSIQLAVILTDLPIKTDLLSGCQNHNDILLIKSRHSLTANEITKVQEYKPVIHPLRQSGLGLGSTHPTLTNITWETLDIRRSRFSLESRYSYRHSHSISLHLALQLGFTAILTLPYHSPKASLHLRYLL